MISAGIAPAGRAFEERAALIERRRKFRHTLAKRRDRKAYDAWWVAEKQRLDGVLANTRRIDQLTAQRA